MRTDWSKRWPDAAKMENKDAKGTAHYPGWSLPVLEFLYQDWEITASGHETHGYRSKVCHDEGRLFARNLHSEHEPLPDRVADKPRSDTRIRSAGGGKFSETKSWLRLSGASVRHFARKPI